MMATKRCLVGSSRSEVRPASRDVSSKEVWPALDVAADDESALFVPGQSDGETSESDSKVLRRKRKRSKKRSWLHAWECNHNRRVYVVHKNCEVEAIVQFVEGDAVRLRLSNGELTTVIAGPAKPGVRRSPTVAKLTRPPRVEAHFSAPANVKDDEKLRNKALFAAREKEANAERVKVWDLHKTGLRKEGPTSTEKRWSSMFDSKLRERYVILECCSGTNILTKEINRQGYSLGIRGVSIDHNPEACADVTMDLAEADMPHFLDKFENVLGFFCAVPCESGCPIAKANYGRHIDPTVGHGADLSEVCDFRLDNQIGVMGAMFQCWKFLFKKDPSIRVCLECPRENFLYKTIRFRKFAHQTGSVLLPYDHCSRIIGLDFKKPGYLTTNLFTLPSPTVPLSDLLCPKNHIHTPSTRRGPALTAAGAYTDSFASFLAHSFINHHFLSWYHPVQFAAAEAHYYNERLPSHGIELSSAINI